MTELPLDSQVFDSGMLAMSQQSWWTASEATFEITEQRGLCRGLDDSFVLPELAKSRLCRLYPHLSLGDESLGPGLSVRRLDGVAHAA